MLADQLKSSREQVLTLQAELAIYQKLLEEAKKKKKQKSAGGEAGALTGAAEGGLLDERTMRVLEEVARLREQLDSSIQNNNTLAEELRARLDQSYSEGNISQEGGVSHVDKATGTSGTHTKEKGSGSGHTHHQRTVQTQYTVKANVTSAGFQTKPRGGH